MSNILLNIKNKKKSRLNNNNVNSIIKSLQSSSNKNDDDNNEDYKKMSLYKEELHKDLVYFLNHNSFNCDFDQKINELTKNSENKNEVFHKLLTETMVKVLKNTNITMVEKINCVSNYGRHLVNDIDESLFSQYFNDFYQKVKNNNIILDQILKQSLTNSIKNEIIILGNEYALDFNLKAMSLILSEENNNSETKDIKNYNRENKIIVDLFLKNGILPTEEFSIEELPIKQRIELMEMIGYFIGKEKESDIFLKKITIFKNILLPIMSLDDSLIFFKSLINELSLIDSDQMYNVFNIIKNHYFNKLQMEDRDIFIFSLEGEIENKLIKNKKEANKKIEVKKNETKKIKINKNLKNSFNNKNETYKLFSFIISCLVITLLVFFC